MSGHLFDLNASHVATNGDDWYTPRWIFDAAGITFDMDVAAPIDPAMQAVPAHDGPAMILVPAVKSRWVGTLLGATEAMTLLTVEFIRPGGEVAPIRWLNILAAKGEPCVPAVARIAAQDKHANGGYMVRGAA